MLQCELVVVFDDRVELSVYGMEETCFEAYLAAMRELSTHLSVSGEYYTGRVLSVTYSWVRE